MGAINEKFNTAELVERRCINWYSKKKGDIIEMNTISNVGSYADEDFTFTSGRTFVVAEVKVRDFESDKYPTAFLELDKVNRLMKRGVEYAVTTPQILYFAFYKGNNKLLIFDLMNTPHKMVYKSCPVSTMDMSRGYIHKAMVEFQIEDAIEIIDIV